MARWIRPSTRVGIYLRDGYVCLYCGRRLSRSETTLDHLVPRCQGGSNRPSNLVTSCQPCNREKHTKTWKEYSPDKGQEIRRRTRRKVRVDEARVVLATNAQLTLNV